VVDKTLPVKEEVDSKGLVAHDLSEAVVKMAHSELLDELHWVHDLKQSLAAVVAFARIEAAKELRDPIKVRAKGKGQNKKEEKK
jgi:hypothetical protein